MGESKHSAFSFKTYILFGIGALGYGILGNMASSFISFYYTDIIGVSAAIVSFMLISVRLFDAVNDTIIGAIADRTNTKWGRYRPWMFMGGLLWVVCVILLFHASPEWNPIFSAVWMFALYCIISMASGAAAMAHAALLGIISDTSMQRAKLSASKQFFSLLGAMVSSLSFSSLVVLLAGDDRASGYSQMAVIVGCISFAVIALTCVTMKERPIKPISKEKSTIKRQLVSFFRNPLMVAVVVGFFLQGLLSYGRNGMLMYYFTYVCNNSTLMATYSILINSTNMIGCLAAPYVLNLFKHKGRLSAFNSFVAGIAMIICYFTPAPSMLFWVFMILAAFFQGVQTTITFSMIADAADYSEWKLGIRNDGFYSALSTFGLKSGGAIMPSVGLFIITAAGYIPNAVQTPVSSPR